MQPIQQHAPGTSETTRCGYLQDFAQEIVFKACFAFAFTLAIMVTPASKAQEESIALPLPEKAPVVPDVPNRNPVLNDVEEENALPAEGEIADRPPVPSRKARRAGRRVISNKPFGPAPRPAKWSDRKIAKAREQCKNLLSDAIFEFKPLEPIRKGICGTPAPILLNSIRGSQTVTIRPAAKLNCNMASQFHRWIVEVVQPSARTHLETEIAGVINIASYHCRTRYNDPGQRISQHALANALDLSGFITAKGEQIAVEKFWEGDAPQGHFLKEIHAGACKIFGTVLGPKANAAHKDHFHLDMTKRRHGSFCE